jgi:mono/diheme cytochrome c family protein
MLIFRGRMPGPNTNLRDHAYFRSKAFVLAVLASQLLTAHVAVAQEVSPPLRQAVEELALDDKSGKSSYRWYTEQQVELGRSLFLTHCAVCHGERAEATTEWRKTNANGDYPPPPLNGSAHAWHHPLSVLENSIAVGGIPNGGVMPPFAETLGKQEMRAAIAFFQNFWPDEIYARWLEINSR